MSNQTKQAIVHILFLMVAAIDIFAVIINNKFIEIVTKPLLMTTLVMVYLAGAKRTSFLFVSALFFSFWGDVFLLDKENFFVYGLASFMLVHVLYIRITTGFLQKELTTKIISSSLPFLVLFSIVLYFIYDNLGTMLVPVLVYGIAISTFGASTLLNYRQQKSRENTMLFLGALLFIASDSLIALNNFYFPSIIFDVAIIVLYIVSQYIICGVMIKKSNQIS